MFKIFIMSLLTLASTTISAQTIQECLHEQTSKTIPLQPQQGNYITGNRWITPAQVSVHNSFQAT